MDRSAGRHRLESPWFQLLRNLRRFAVRTTSRPRRTPR